MDVNREHTGIVCDRRATSAEKLQLWIAFDKYGIHAGISNCSPNYTTGSATQLLDNYYYDYY